MRSSGERSVAQGMLLCVPVGAPWCALISVERELVGSRWAEAIQGGRGGSARARGVARDIVAPAMLLASALPCPATASCCLTRPRSPAIAHLRDRAAMAG